VWALQPPHLIAEMIMGVFGKVNALQLFLGIQGSYTDVSPIINETKAVQVRTAKAIINGLSY